MNSLPSTKYVSLSAALSWLAFGDARDGQELNRELAGLAFGTSYDDARQRLETVLSTLTDAGHNGKVQFWGKHLKLRGADVTEAVAKAKTEQLSDNTLRDFRQFDITIDGLCPGSGLAWMLDGEGSWTVASPKLPEAYAEVIVQRSDLMRVFRAGGVITAGNTRQALPHLSEGDLKKWFDTLDPSQKELSQAKLGALCDAAFPHNYVTRKRIRDLTPGRRPGRKPNRP